MGTHSLIRFSHTNRKPTCAVYQQFDGYPSGVGAKLAAFLVSRKLCNGISMTPPEHPATAWANGLGCLIAQYIKSAKDGAGGLYVEDIDTADEEWTYDVIAEGADIQVKVISESEAVFTGTPQQFKKWADEN